jgi:hypothetical protein
MKINQIKFYINNLVEAYKINQMNMNNKMKIQILNQINF